MSKIDAIFQKKLKAFRARNTFASGETFPEKDFVTNTRISVDETNEEALLNAEYGPQQVQSLLSLIVDYPLHKKMEDAVDDYDAVRHLNRLKE